MGWAMRMTAKDRAAPLMTKRGREPKRESLAVLAERHGMPLSTLKTRLKKLIDRGIDREKAIRLALEHPIGPQGRPRLEPQ